MPATKMQLDHSINALLWLFLVSALQAVTVQRALVAEWYKLYGIMILVILTQSRDIFYCYDIPHYIVTLVILESLCRYWR